MVRSVVLPVLVTVLSLAGCSLSGAIEHTSSVMTPTISPLATDSPEVLVPITSSLEALDGTSVSLTPGGFMDVVLPHGPADVWTSSADVPRIVEWMPVEPDSSGNAVATLAAVGSGTAVVTVSDGNVSFSFTVTVSQ